MKARDWIFLKRNYAEVTVYNNRWLQGDNETYTMLVHLINSNRDYVQLHEK